MSQLLKQWARTRIANIEMLLPARLDLVVTKARLIWTRSQVDDYKHEKHERLEAYLRYHQPDITVNTVLPIEELRGIYLCRPMVQKRVYCTDHIGTHVGTHDQMKPIPPSALVFLVHQMTKRMQPSKSSANAKLAGPML